MSNNYGLGSNFATAFATSGPTLSTNVSFATGTPVSLGAPSYSSISSSARAAAAITSLTTFAGGGAMASGTGGIGMIYVQFVVRLLSKIIEFAGLDPQQEQRLFRVHSSVQNLEVNKAAQSSSNAAGSTSSACAASSTATGNLVPTSTTNRPAASSRQTRQSASATDLRASAQSQQQPTRRQGLDRTVRVPINIHSSREIRQRRLCRGVRPKLSQFIHLLNSNTTHMIFRFANKYRPETRVQNKTRRRTEKAFKTANAAVGLDTKEKDKGKGKAKAVVDPGLAYDEDGDQVPYIVRHGMNRCAALVEKQKAQLIVMSEDIEPPEVLIWLPALCRKNKVPYAIIKGSTARLGTLVNKKATSAIVFTDIREEDRVQFSQLVDAINACYASLNQQPARRAWMGGIVSFKSKVKVALRTAEALNRQQQEQQLQQQQQP
ncbi:60S ribosomal protein L8B [Linnemannia exigua]|uniref:60S ribosomal protein L8B n=1 Tax=Linnemannia exigua TaxID=604196 RepID=A0AAD4DED4_9FUNG|nr:60S ribosomal protein L8B [Linnemannia exigua]